MSQLYAPLVVSLNERSTLLLEGGNAHAHFLAFCLVSNNLVADCSFFNTLLFMKQ